MPRMIRQDNKLYTFTPGPNGSLTAPANQPQEIDLNRKKIARMAPSPSVDNEKKYAMRTVNGRQVYGR